MSDRHVLDALLETTRQILQSQASIDKRLQALESKS